MGLTLWHPGVISIVLFGTVAIPLLIHLIPASGPVPIGARLLPIFYAPLIATLLFRIHIGLIAAVLGPLLNYLLLGLPAPEILMPLTFELIIFVWTIYMLKGNWLMGPMAYLAAKVLSSSVMLLIPSFSPGPAPFDFFIQSITNAIPGLIVLLVIGIVYKIWRSRYH